MTKAWTRRKSTLTCNATDQSGDRRGEPSSGAMIDADSFAMRQDARALVETC